MYTQIQDNSTALRDRQPELQELVSRLQSVNDNQSKLLIQIKGKLSNILSVPSCIQSRPEPSGKMDSETPTALNTLKIFIEQSHENSEKLEDILNHLNQIV